MVQRRRVEATGVIGDLFAECVGFYAGWGFSRSIHQIEEGLLGRSGHIDWRSAEMIVRSAVAEMLGLPRGARREPARLYRRVAVGEIGSAWSRVPGGRGRGRGKSERLVAVRYHFGKRRVRGEKLNAVCLQYRVWNRERSGAVTRVSSSRQAEPLFADLHGRLRLQIEGEKA
jgi:hypothetical protein